MIGINTDRYNLTIISKKKQKLANTMAELKREIEILYFKSYR